MKRWSGGSRPIPWWRTCFCSTGFIPTIWRREPSQALAKFPHASQLVGVLDNIVHVRISGGSKESVEAMLRDALPDAAAILVEETIQPGFVPLAALLTADSRLG